MNQKERAMYAKQIVENPLWELMKTEIPRYYYDHFRENADPVARERVATAHDIFGDVMRYVEGQAAMGEILEFPEMEAVNERPS
jgi:hypothetical protein